MPIRQKVILLISPTRGVYNIELFSFYYERLMFNGAYQPKHHFIAEKEFKKWIKENLITQIASTTVQYTVNIL